MYTLAGPDTGFVELFLVAKESGLFATAACLQQVLVWTKKLGVDYRMPVGSCPAQSRSFRLYCASSNPHLRLQLVCSSVWV